MSKPKKLSICVISESNSFADPRPARVINYLKNIHSITVIGRDVQQQENIMALSYDRPQKRTFIQDLKLYYNIFLRRYISLVKIPTRMKIVEDIKRSNFDIIFCHDLILLPIILENKKNAKVIFDAREFYPKENEKNFRWKLLFSNFNDWLCRKYLKHVDYMYSVSYNYAKEYGKAYNIQCNVLHSLPKYYDYNKIKINNGKIKIIHHGVANEDRLTHLMIEMMDYVDERFELDLMILPNQQDYFKKLNDMVKIRSNVNIIPAVKYEQIIPFISNYDIGLFLAPPNSFNLEFCLPNKFFEFIQARLAIAIGPSVEMKKFIEKYDLGVFSDEFTPKSLAEKLNNLTENDILKFKKNSNEAAKVLNSNSTNLLIEKIIKEVLS